MQFKLHFKCKLKIQNHRWHHQHQSVRCERRKVPKHLHRLVPDPATTHRVRSLNHIFFCIYSMILYISTNNLLDRHRHANQPYGFWQRDFSNWNYSEHLYFILIVSVESVVDSRILSLKNEVVIPAKTDDMQNTVRRRFIDARLIEFYAKIVPYVLRHWHWGFGFICVILPRVNFNNLQHAKRNNAKWMNDKIIFGHIFV